MTKTGKDKAAAASQSKGERLAAALRANLQKRKAQSRERRQADHGSAAGDSMPIDDPVDGDAAGGAGEVEERQR